MRRYRFGRIAALVAVAYVAGVGMVVSADWITVAGVVVPVEPPHLMELGPWARWVLLPVAVLQGWALWQVLRGPVLGGAARVGWPGGAAGWLRVALYASVAHTLLLHLWPPDDAEWATWSGALVRLAVVGLYVPVLAASLPRWVRLGAFVAGIAAVAADLGYGPGDTPIWLLWAVPVLVGQARDPRWSRGTVWTGAIFAAAWLLRPTSFAIRFPRELDPGLLFEVAVVALGALGAVWEARSAHELTRPPETAPRPAGARPRMAEARSRSTGARSRPAGARPGAVRRPSFPLPLAGVAVALPLIPVAVNLAHGVPRAIDPGGAVADLLRISDRASLAWYGLDLLLGVGAPALLVLAAVARRTRTAVRVTAVALLGCAALVAVSALTLPPARLGGTGPDLAPGPDPAALPPLWHAAALTAAALLLLAIQAGSPRRHTLLAATAAALALCFLPAADLAPAKVTTAEDCARAPRTSERAYLCAIRVNATLDVAAGTPDHVLLARGRRLCAVHTRQDPAELAGLRSEEGVDPERLPWVIDDICPSAHAAAVAAETAEKVEYEQSQAEERRKCDAAPRHRPLITPAKAVRVKEPQWPDGSLSLFETVDDSFDPLSQGVFSKALANGLVAGGRGHLVILTHSDVHACVTLETYARRPPVETGGWEHVVEVGYDSPAGDLRLRDDLSGIVLPDLSLRGRPGHYRVRVHFAWLPWNGGRYGTQRLLVMAYPGDGDDVRTYRAPPP
ncbi:hypothetical protein [Nonomuraea wenchangensis]|uniref:hypothetical protein n=2 Tax=Nonomuraea wenchangensis TaxID=568860 RepID=UPI00332E9CDE